MKSWKGKAERKAPPFYFLEKGKKEKKEKKGKREKGKKGKRENFLIMRIFLKNE